MWKKLKMLTSLTFIKFFFEKVIDLVKECKVYIKAEMAYKLYAHIMF